MTTTKKGVGKVKRVRKVKAWLLIDARSKPYAPEGGYWIYKSLKDLQWWKDEGQRIVPCEITYRV